jgi:nucleotide-binding universal stress UspA family protein
VVVPVRRRSPTMKLFLGSIAQELILEAPCPVVAVKSSQ